MTKFHIFIAVASFMITTITHANEDNKLQKQSTYKFTDTPKLVRIDKAETELALQAVVAKTVTVYGSGGYNPNTGAICPDSSSNVCAYIITERTAGGTWGPSAAVEDAMGNSYIGVIDHVIEDSNGSVVNFVFSSLTPL